MFVSWFVKVVALRLSAILLQSCQAADDSGLQSIRRGLVRRHGGASDLQLQATSLTGTEEWIFCAGQWQECVCSGKIRWGSKRGWTDIGVKKEAVKCSPFDLGDPAPGDATKHCECAVGRNSSDWSFLSPAVLADTSETPAVSCKTMEDVSSESAWASAQWQAVRGLCSPLDAASMLEVGVSAGGSLTMQSFISSAGKASMKERTMRSLMRAWIDKRFRKNYERVYDKSGWVDQAFINYVGNSPSGRRYAKINEQLIRSVHEFSSRPIVVVHFGMTPPEEWDPVRFPRLVLLHAAPMTEDDRSFNFNKFRAMLLAQAKTGILLDSDQFVAPGIDNMFKRTEDEVTKEYPLPILPAHFLTDWTPKNAGSWWQRFCYDDGRCPRQTLRWGHGHPTYTYWALPFFGRWLRRTFRDESLPRRKDTGPTAQLRVLDVREDEDLFNVGLWEEGGKKQWCKFDNPDPTDFHMLLEANATTLNCAPESYCNDIGVDPTFYPIGSPHVFYTAHHAVKPDVSADYIDRLLARKQKGDLPPPILWRGHFTDDFRKLLEQNPNIGCLI